MGCSLLNAYVHMMGEARRESSGIISLWIIFVCVFEKLTAEYQKKDVGWFLCCLFTDYEWMTVLVLGCVSVLL